MGYKSGVAVIGTVATEIASGRLIGGGPKFFALLNTGPATFVSGVIEVGPDVGQYGTFDGTTFATLGSATLAQAFAPERHQPFFRMRAAVASGSVATCNYWFAW